MVGSAPPPKYNTEHTGQRKMLGQMAVSWTLPDGGISTDDMVGGRLTIVGMYLFNPPHDPQVINLHHV